MGTRFTNNFYSHRSQQFPVMNTIMTPDEVIGTVGRVMPQIEKFPRAFIAAFVWDYFSNQRTIYSNLSTPRWKMEFLARLSAELYDVAQLMNNYEFDPQEFMFNGWEQWVQRDLIEDDVRRLDQDTKTDFHEDKTHGQDNTEHLISEENIVGNLIRADDERGTANEKEQIDFESHTDVRTTDNNVNTFFDHPMSVVPTMNPSPPPEIVNHGIPTNRTTNSATGTSLTDFTSHSDRNRDNEYQDFKDREQDTTQDTDFEHDITKREDYEHRIDNHEHRIHEEDETELKVDDEHTHTLNNYWDVQERLAISLKSYHDMNIMLRLMNNLSIMFLTTSIDVNYV